MLYLKYNDEDKWGLYLLDIPSGKSSLVSEIVTEELGAQEGAPNAYAKILGWSPGDTYFAYARPDPNGQDRHTRNQVAICDGASGVELGSGSLQGPVSTGAWLSSDRLLCSDGAEIYEFSQSPGGWITQLFYRPPEAPGETNAAAPPESPLAGEIKSLASFLWNSAVWQQSNAIYVGERGRAPKMIWRATNSTLLEFAFSSTAGKFLLHCKDHEGEFLVDYYPRILSFADTFTNVVRLDTRDYQPQQVTLINNGHGYAYLNHNDFSSEQTGHKSHQFEPAGAASMAR